MRHRRLRRRMGVKREHRRALLRNLVRGLVQHKRIRTTLVRAKEASAFSDKLVELAKRGDLHARRQLIAKLGCADTAGSLIKDIAPHFKERKGGYTRVVRLNFRPGDGAPMALLEFSTTIVVPETEEEKKAKKAKKKAKKAKAPAEAPEKKKKDPSSDAAATEEKKPKKGEAPQKDKEDKKETEKRGGFLGTLRKFLKGDE